MSKSKYSPPKFYKIEQLKNKLLYSSTFEEETYYNMYGEDVPENTPVDYIDLAVLSERLKGTGTQPFHGETDDTDEDYVGPSVVTLKGELTIEIDNEDDSLLFVNKLKSRGETYTSFGSIENYHPMVQTQVLNGESYDAGLVWATMIEKEDLDDGNVHFCQLVLDR
jgi:hypothetical protein